MHNTKKIFMIFFICAAFLSALGFILLYGISYFADLDKYKADFFRAAEQKTGFKISCEKAEFIKGFSPYLKLHLYHTGITAPDNTAFLQIKEADLRIKTLPLLMKKIEIKDAVIVRPIINITLYEDYLTSVEKYLNEIKNSAESVFIPENISLDAECRNYKIKLLDKSIDKNFYIEGSLLKLNSALKDKKIKVQADGKIYDNKNEYISYDFDILTALNENNKQLFLFSPFKTMSDYKIKGSIKGNIKKHSADNIKGALSVKDLSMKLDGLSNAKSNAGFIFNGNEASFNAQLRTSEKDEAELKGIFKFGKTRFIDFNTNAENINLENLSKIISSISKILNINSPLAGVNAQGLLNANFNIKSDFKKLKSRGRAEIINASAESELIPFPVSNINAQISFENNQINLEKASADINKTPVILEGKINSSLDADLKLYSDNIDLKNASSAFKAETFMPFNIKKGSLDFVSKINGNLGSELKTDSYILIKNLAVQEKKTNIPLNAYQVHLTIKTKNNKYEGDAQLRRFSTEYKGHPVKARDLYFKFDEKNIKIAPKDIVLISSPLTINGEIKDYMSKTPEYTINFKGDISSNNIAAVLKPYIKFPCRTSGVLNTQGSINYKDNTLKLKSKINADKDNYISYAVIKELLNKPSSLSVDIEAGRNFININDISVSEEKNTALKITGQIENNEKEPVLKNVNILIPNTVTTASDFFGGEEMSFYGNITLNKKLSSPEIKGNIKLLHYYIKKYLISIKNADINFMPSNIRITAPDTAVNNSDFNITMDVMPDLNDITISKMQVNSMNLDLNSMFELIKDADSPLNKAPITVKNGSAVINRFRAADLKARDISSDFKLEKNILKISNVNASAYAGSLSGKADYNLKSGILNIDAAGKNLDIRSSMKDLSGFDDNIYGKTDARVLVSMLAGPKNTVLRTLTGSMEFNAHNGRMGTLGRFEYYLSAQNLLYNGLLNTSLKNIAQAVSNDTANFNYAEGRVLLQNGYIISDIIRTQGRKMSLLLKGRHNMLTNLSNLDIYGRISADESRKTGSFGDVSISDIINGGQIKKENIVIYAPAAVINEIPNTGLRAENADSGSKTFKVNVSGDIKALNAVKSFNWIVPEGGIIAEKEEENKEEKLPDFSDL